MKCKRILCSLLASVLLATGTILPVFAAETASGGDTSVSVAEEAEDPLTTIDSSDPEESPEAESGAESLAEISPEENSSEESDEILSEEPEDISSMEEPAVASNDSSSEDVFSEDVSSEDVSSEETESSSETDLTDAASAEEALPAESDEEEPSDGASETKEQEQEDESSEEAQSETSSTNSSETDPEDSDEKTADDQEVNNSGNLVNGGRATEYNGIVYYANAEDEDCLYAKDGSSEIKLTNYNVQYLNVTEDGTLFYTFIDGENSLTKIMAYSIKDRADRMIYAIDMIKGIKNLIVRGDDCWFISDGTVYRLNLRTGDRETLLGGKDDVSAFVLFDGGYAYSRITGNGTPLAVYSYETMRETVVSQYAGSFDAAGNYVYFADRNDGDRLHRVKLDGTKDEALSDGGVTGVITANNKVYYRNSDSIESEVLVYDVKAEEEQSEGSGTCSEFTVLPSEEVITEENTLAEVAPAGDETDDLQAASMGDLDYRKWKQYDPRWANEVLGADGETMKQSGCLVTSLAILIVDSGVRTEAEGFNPQYFVRALRNNGGFYGSTSNLYWDKVHSVVKVFNVSTWGNGDVSQTTLQAHLKKGNKVVLDVGGHYVALASLSGSNAKIYDPGYDRTTYSINDGVYTYSSYTVSASVKPTYVTLNKTSITLDSDATYRLVPSFPSAATDTTVTWKTSDISVAKVSTAGLVRGVKPGTATITVKTANGKTATCKVTVRQPVPATAITLNKTSATINMGDKLTLSKTLTPSNATGTVTWSSSNTKVATVTSSGVVLGVTAGTATITATTQSGKKATCKVTVKAVTLVKYKVTGDKVNYRTSPSIYAASKGQLVKGAVVYVVSGYSKVADGYTWYKLKVGSNYYYAVKTYLTKVVSAITLNRTSMNLYKGYTNTLKATVAATNKTVTWTSSDKSVATVSSTGVVKGIKLGTATITAKTAAGKTATCKVTIVAPVTGVKLNKISATLQIGRTLTLTPTISPTNAYNKKVTWSTSDKTIATVTSAGVVKGIKTGTVKITAKTHNGKTAVCTIKVIPEILVKYKVTGDDVNYRSSPSLKGTIKNSLQKGTIVNVVSDYSKTADGYTWYKLKIGTQYYYVVKNYLKKVAVAPTGVTLNTTSRNLYKGNSFTLKATVAPSTATNKTVTWSSSNKAVATVSSTGVVKGIKLGTATITAKTANGKTAACKVTIVAPVTGVKLNKTTASVQIGKTITLTPTISPSNAYNKKVTWSTSNKAVATVTSAGVVKGIKAGTVKITAKSHNGKTAVCTVTVKGETLVKYKTTTELNYRSLPGTTGDTIKGTLAKGVTVNVVSGYSKSANGYTWVKIKIGTKYYYVANKYLVKV